MKHTYIYSLLIGLMLLLPTALSAWEISPWDNSPMYKPIGMTSTSMTLPKSTIGFGKIAAIPQLSEGGYAIDPIAQRPGPLRERGDGGNRDNGTGNAGTPGEGTWNKDRLPIGDALLPLCLFAAAYAACKVRKRKQEQC